MFSPQRRVLARSVQARLIRLGRLSIVSLLMITSSLYLTSAWLLPDQPALAQSDATTPTAVPQPSATPAPTAGLSEPPLTLHSSASVARAAAGEQFSFTTSIAASSAEPRAVELRASIGGQIDLVSVSGGSCSALACKLSVQRGQSVTIVATVQVRPNASPGQLVYQALAQDDLSTTAASDQVVVTIAAPPAEPTTPPAPAPSPPPSQARPASGGSAPTQPASRPTRPAPTAAQASVAIAVAQSTAAPAALALPSVSAAAMHRSADADSWLELAPAAPTQPLDPPVSALAAPQPEAPLAAQPAPTDASAAAPMAAKQRLLVQLPNTAAAPPSVVLVGFLLGLALTIHGVRRVRRAAAQLDQQSTALGDLTTLVDVRARQRAGMEADDID
jgi:hypothetical protein